MKKFGAGSKSNNNSYITSLIILFLSLFITISLSSNLLAKNYSQSEGIFNTYLPLIFKPLSSEPSFSFLSADVNGDSLVDLIAVDTKNLVVRVALSQETKISEHIVSSPFPNGIQAVSKILVADVNGDTNADLILVDNLAGGRIYVGLGESSGLFSFQASQATPSDISLLYEIILEDINGDSRSDLIWVNDSEQDSILVGLGTAIGTFSFLPNEPISLDNPAGYRYLSGDFNGDGLSDLIWAGSFNAEESYNLQVSLSDGTGIFTPQLPQEIVFDLDNSYQFYTGDLNGDSREDLIWISNSPVGQVLTAIANEDATFSVSPIQDHPGNIWNKSFSSVEDINGDGKDDLIWNDTKYFNQVQVGFVDDNGSLNLLPVQRDLQFERKNSISLLGDINGDGKSDLIWVDDKFPNNLTIGYANSNGQFALGAATAAQLEVRVIIESVKALDDVDTLDGADFYASINIDGVSANNKAGAIGDDDNISPNWEFFDIVDSSRGVIPLVINIYDEDGFLNFDDDQIDIKARSGRELFLDLDLNNCTIEGDGLTSNCGSTITSAGGENDRAEISFRVEVKPALPVKLTLTIERIKGLDCIDFAFIGCGDPEFYSRVMIDNQELDNRANYIEGEDISPNWEFSKLVDLSKGSIPLSIDIYDEDDGFNGGDDHVDLQSTSGRTLDLTIDLDECLNLSAGSGITGDVTGECRVSLNSSGTSNDRAQIWFKVEVEAPPSAPLTNVRCLHEPIWPQSSDTVMITAEPLDENLGFKGTDVEIEIWLDDNTEPFIAIGNSPVSLSVPAGTYGDGENFSYGCLVRDKTNGEEVWSGWRNVQVGDPPSGRSVPLIFNGSRSSNIDIVFIADRDNYADPTDPDFVNDVSSIIEQGYYSQAIYLAHQDKLNFWIALDMGLAEDSGEGCDHELPGGYVIINNVLIPRWDIDYAFADTGAIVHRNFSRLGSFFRDCAPGGERIFSGDISYWGPRSVFLHETGHRPFGLADEYCCDGGYYQNDPFPNVYEEPEDCVNDIPELQIWDDKLGHLPVRDTTNCREFIEENVFLWFDLDWSSSDPISNDLMVDNTTIRGADARRIDWLFEQCASASCGHARLEYTTSIQTDDVFDSSLAIHPTVDPFPEFDYDDQSKTVIVRLEFEDREVVNLESTFVTYNQTYTRLGDPPLLRIKLFDEDNNLIEEFNAWHPMWEFGWENDGESRIISEYESGQFAFPFSSYLATMEVTDIGLEQVVATVDLASTVQAFCAENTADPGCLADLSITKSDSPDPVIAGTMLTYTITVTNSGPIDATSVTVQDLLPDSLSFMPDLSSSDCSEASGIVTCSVEALADGSNVSFIVVVEVDPSVEDGHIITNEAIVASDQTDPNINDNTTIQETTVIRRADLAVSGFDEPDPVIITELLTYTINVSNLGPSFASGVVLTDSLPASVMFVEASSNCVYDESAHTVACVIEELMNGGNSTISISVTPLAPGLITNRLEVTGNEIDPQLRNNSTFISTTAHLLIDIRPDREPNKIFLENNKFIQVTIFSSTGFYAPSDLVWDSLTFGLTGEEDSLRFHLSRMQGDVPACRGDEDINNDGLFDLTCTFEVAEMDFDLGPAIGILEGQLLRGAIVTGQDDVEVVLGH